MDSLSIPTVASPLVYHPGLLSDDISVASSISFQFFDTDSLIYNPSFASSESIASYKTEKSITSRKSRYNAAPRHKYAGTDHLMLPRGSVSLDVDDSSILETELRDESDEATKTARTREGSKEAHQSGPRPIQEYEAPVADIIQTVERFRLLVVGRSGVGKSSLINSAFGINAAQITDFIPGQADIQQEFVSLQNRDFVLHCSKGLEPGDFSSFKTARDLIRQRSRQGLPLSERIHALWLCTETPMAGGRIFEAGDEMLLQFAHKNQVPIVIVFTKYDRLVRMKELELRQKYPDMEATGLRDQSVEDSRKAFRFHLQLLRRSMERLGILMPRYATALVRPSHPEDVSDLVQATRDIVRERFKDDAMVLAIARAGLPVKINICVTGIGSYRRALTGSEPELGQLSLSECLGKVHKDIISCWNFKGEVLNSSEFQQLMLCLVQDVHTKPTATILPDVDTISQFVTLVTAASATIFPPVAILGTKYVFVQWLSTAVIEEAPLVQRLLIAYTVDLIRILRELFAITLRHVFTLRVSWTELQEAIEAYERPGSRKRIHYRIRSKLPLSGPVLTTDDISSMVHELLQDSS